MKKFRIWDGKTMHYDTCRFLIDSSDGSVVENATEDGNDKLVYVDGAVAQESLTIESTSGQVAYEGDCVQLSTNQIYGHRGAAYVIGELALSKFKGVYLHGAIYVDDDGVASKKGVIHLNMEGLEFDIIGNLQENPGLYSYSALQLP